MRNRTTGNGHGFFLTLLASVQPQASFTKKIPANGRVLDVGCGDFDRIQRYVGNRRSDIEIVGIERYAEATIYGPLDGSRVPTAAKQYRRLACNIETESFPFADDSFDAVYFAHVIEHIHEKDRALNEIRRVLKANGILYVETPGPRATFALRPPWLPSKLGGTLHYNDDETHVGEPMNLAVLGALLSRSGFQTLESGAVRELGLWGIPLYAAMSLLGLARGLPERARSFLYGAGVRNLVGWAIFAIASPSLYVAEGASASAMHPQSGGGGSATSARQAHVMDVATGRTTL